MYWIEKHELNESVFESHFHHFIVHVNLGCWVYFIKEKTDVYKLQVFIKHFNTSCNYKHITTDEKSTISNFSVYLGIPFLFNLKDHAIHI